ncbi:MAG: hypothetical protein IJ518_01930 [Clostridia bacterium]|nr:hypothetical protein [Clostridia bacterium]
MGAGLAFPPMYSNSVRYEDMAALLEESNLNLVIPMPSYRFQGDKDGFYEAFEAVGMDMIAAPDILYMNHQPDESAAQAEILRLREKFSHIIGFFAWDEPRIEVYDSVKRMCDLIIATDPSAVPLTCLLPSYNGQHTWYGPTEDTRYPYYVDAFVEQVNPPVLTQDHYPFQQYGLNTNMKENTYWKDLGYMTKVAQAQGKPYWQWVSGIHEWRYAASDKMTMGHMRLQINGALAYGVQGVLIFTANECIITNDLEKSEKFEEMAALNKQTRHIGNLLLSAEREAVYHNTGYTDPVVAYIDALSESEIIAEAPVWGPGLIVSLFREGDVRYLVVVSKNYMRTVSGTITLKKPYEVAAYDADTDTFAEAIETASVPYELDKGGIAVYRLS